MTYQMTLEDLYCNNTVKPEIDALIATVDTYKESPPKNHKTVRVIIKQLEFHLDKLRSMENNLQHLSAIESDDSKTQDA